jgi:hypothetical protein
MEPIFLLNGRRLIGDCDEQKEREPPRPFPAVLLWDGSHGTDPTT